MPETAEPTGMEWIELAEAGERTGKHMAQAHVGIVSRASVISLPDGTR